MKNEDKCSVPYCRKKRAKHTKECHMHSMRKTRAKHPINYVYNALKFNAKRRDKYFDLTLAEFKEFVDETKYMELKGRSAVSLTIDRKQEHLGYTKSNIQAITLAENLGKYNKYKYTKNCYDPECGF